MKGTRFSATPKQYELNLKIEKEKEVDGVGMGVLSDGTPYLTGRGLARMCGVARSTIQHLSDQWSANVARPVVRIRNILKSQGMESMAPYIAIAKDGTDHHAYPDFVCMAVLEYYAFEAGKNVNDKAQRNYRLLARASFKEFIYTQVGYDPRIPLPSAWEQFHDRVSLAYDRVPHGYFSVFKEIADVVVTLIRAGAQVGPEFVPDISVGRRWAAHWQSNGLARMLGESQKFEHRYPESFPQSVSNPQEASCYPDAALPEFRRWMREVYLPNQFPEYLRGRVSKNALPPSFVEVALLAVDDRLDKGPA